MANHKDSRPSPSSQSHAATNRTPLADLCCVLLASYIAIIGTWDQSVARPWWPLQEPFCGSVVVLATQLVSLLEAANWLCPTAMHVLSTWPNVCWIACSTNTAKSHLAADGINEGTIPLRIVSDCGSSVLSLFARDVCVRVHVHVCE